MSKRKKKRNLGPRRKRLQRRARIEAALKWRGSYGGKHLVRGYARWFGVDLLCAMTELRMLGVAIDTEYEGQVRQTISVRAAANARRRATKLEERTKPIAVEWPPDWPSEWPPDDADDENPF